MAEVETQIPAASNAPAGSTANQTPVKKEKKAKNPRTKPTHPPTSEMVNSAIVSLKERGGSSLQAIKKYISANYKVDAEKMAPFIKKYLKSSVVSGGLVQTKGKGASGSFKMASATLKKAPVKSSGTTSEKKKPTSPGVKKDKIKKKPAAKKRAASTQKATSAAAPTTVAPSTPVKSPAKKPSGKAAKKMAASPVSTSDAEKKTQATRTKAKKATAAESKKKAASPAKVAAVAAVTKTKSPMKAKKASKAGPTKKPKTPKPKSTKAAAAASPKAKKAASPKKRK